MIEIKRKRYVITRKHRGETEIFCGLSRNYTFKQIGNIGNTAIKTYVSKKKALSSYLMSWYSAKPEDVDIIEVEEILKEVE